MRPLNHRFDHAATSLLLLASTACEEAPTPGVVDAGISDASVSSSALFDTTNVATSSTDPVTPSTERTSDGLKSTSSESPASTAETLDDSSERSSPTAPTSQSSAGAGSSSASELPTEPAHTSMPESSTGADSASVRTSYGTSDRTAELPTWVTGVDTRAGIDAGTDAGGKLNTSGADASTPDARDSGIAPLEQSTHGAWCESPIPIIVVKGSGSILNNPWDNLSQVDAEVIERLTICPGEQTQYCDATADGGLSAVMMRECELPPQVCPASGSVVTQGCSQTTMEDIFGGWGEEESSHYVAQGCCFESQLGEVYTATCTPELDGARCPRANPCLEHGYCESGECTDGPARECDDGFFCNGLESCLTDVGCVPGPVPQFDDDPCTTDACDEPMQTSSHATATCAESCETATVNVGLLNIMPSTVRPDLNALATTPNGGAWTETLQLACDATMLPSFPQSFGEWSCARTTLGEVFVVNEWGLPTSQPVASGCSYEMQYWEAKTAGMNGYEGFVFGCCLDTEPFNPTSPNIEPLPPGP